MVGSIAAGAGIAITELTIGVTTPTLQGPNHRLGAAMDCATFEITEFKVTQIDGAVQRVIRRDAVAKTKITSLSLNMVTSHSR